MKDNQDQTFHFDWKYLREAWKFDARGKTFQRA